jgi:hypothetical protein
MEQHLLIHPASSVFENPLLFYLYLKNSPFTFTFFRTVVNDIQMLQVCYWYKKDSLKRLSFVQEPKVVRDSWIKKQHHNQTLLSSVNLCVLLSFAFNRLCQIFFVSSVAADGSSLDQLVVGLFRCCNINELLCLLTHNMELQILQSKSCFFLLCS